MAKEHEEHGRHEGGRHEEAGKGKKHLAVLAHHFHEDGSVTHEHTYKDKPDSAFHHPPRMVGTSQSLEDAQQHLADHWPQQEEAEPGQGEGQGEGEEEEQTGAEPGGAGAEEED